MNKKFLMFGAVIFLVLVGSVLAIWLVSIYSSATYRIDSQIFGGLFVTQELTGASFDTLPGKINSLDEFKFTNDGAATEMNITITTTKTQTNSSCSNWQNDCDVEYGLNGGWNSLSEGTNTRTIKNGENIIQVNITCLQYSCPQDITPEILVEKLPV